MQQFNRDDRGILDLLKELSTEGQTLVRQEVALAKAELAEKAVNVGKDLAFIAAGAFVALAGGLALLYALILGLTVLLAGPLDDETARWLAPLIVGVLIVVAAGALIWTGYSSLKRRDLVPRKTTETIQETKEWMKEKIA